MRPCCTSFARTLWPSYLSFTTLTSTGLSDVIPVQPQARALLMTEQLAGVMYLALVVSRLVGLTLPRRSEVQLDR